MIIFTNDDEKFLAEPHVLMVGRIDTPPTSRDLTYILRTSRFTQKDVEAWLPYVAKKLVVCIDKPPKITGKLKDSVIFDDTYKKTKNNFMNNITSILSWTDRKRVWKSIQDLPIPYGLAFLRVNRDDINLWRRIADANMELPDDYVRAIFAYGVEPKRSRTEFPKKKGEAEEVPYPFRQNDKYWREILKTAPAVANEVREGNDTVPKGMKKRKQAVNEWI